MKRLKTSPRLRGTAKGLTIALGVQAALALGLTVPHALAFSRAQEVKLQTIPVDPRDPLRGHYLTLSYTFSRAKVPPEVKAGQSIYLPLTKGTGNLWTGGSVQTTRPAGVFLKGRVVYVYDQQASINYGIERFYMEESAARAEDERRWPLA